MQPHLIDYGQKKVWCLNFLPKVVLQPVIVDCANGVGAGKLKVLAERLPTVLAVELRNTGDGQLNHECGADYLQSHRQLPTQFLDVPDSARYAISNHSPGVSVYNFPRTAGPLPLSCTVSHWRSVRHPLKVPHCRPSL